MYFLIVAGSFASAISDLIDDPSSAMTTLGSSLPAISVLFINYALNVTLIQIPADMIRLPVMFLFLFYKDVLKEKSLTRRQLVNGPLEDEHLDYGVVLPQLMYLMVLTINYWTISPILIGVLVFTFCGQYLRFKYKLLYIYVPRYESGGYFWYGLYKYTMYALVASTVTMIAYMGIKEGPTQAALLLPLLYVIFKAWKFAEFHHKDVSMFVAYSSAVEADCKTYASPDAATKLYESFHADYYKQPYFSAAQIAVVQPYRIDGTPLFTNNGNLDSVYYKEIANSAQIGSGAHSHLQSAAHAGYRPPSYVASSVHRHTINQMAQPSSDEFIKVGGTRIDEHEL